MTFFFANYQNCVKLEWLFLPSITSPNNFANVQYYRYYVIDITIWIELNTTLFGSSNSKFHSYWFGRTPTLNRSKRNFRQKNWNSLSQACWNVYFSQDPPQYLDLISMYLGQMDSKLQKNMKRNMKFLRTRVAPLLYFPICSFFE